MTTLHPSITLHDAYNSREKIIFVRHIQVLEVDRPIGADDVAATTVYVQNHHRALHMVAESPAQIEALIEAAEQASK